MGSDQVPIRLGLGVLVIVGSLGSASADSEGGATPPPATAPSGTLPGAASGEGSESARPPEVLSPEAQRAEQAKTFATEHFDAGVRWMEQGRCEQTPVGDRDLCIKARVAFTRAFSMYPEGLGALRNLANVEQALELWASASKHYRELVRRAPLDPKPARRGWADLARRELQPIENRIPHLLINPPNPSPDGVRILVDGVNVPKETWSVAMEVDPGDHTVEAQAPGYLPFTVAISLSTAETRALTVDLLREPHAEAAPVVTPVRGVERPVDKPKAQRHLPRSGGLPLAVAATGVVGIGVGLVFGYATIAKKDSACGSDGGCDPDGFSRGKSLGDVSTAFTIAGSVMLAGGLVWYFVDRAATGAAPVEPPKSHSTTARGRVGKDFGLMAVPVLGAGQAGFAVQGRF